MLRVVSFRILFAKSFLTEGSLDFERVLRLDPKNDAAQQELKKVVHAIQERDSRLKKVRHKCLVTQLYP